jgi:hypothetical protein
MLASPDAFLDGGFHHLLANVMVGITVTTSLSISSTYTTTPLDNSIENSLHHTIAAHHLTHAQHCAKDAHNLIPHLQAIKLPAPFADRGRLIRVNIIHREHY